MRAMATQSMAVMAALAPLATSLTHPAYTPMGPTMPQVPMPEATPPEGSFIWNWNTQVARGPVMAEVKMAGSQMRGLRTMLPICSMEVPRPWLMRPPHRFSRKERKAKPTMLAQQPATAAPPASPVRPMAAQMAAEEMGRVRATPMTTDTRMPIQKGWSTVAHSTKLPTEEAAVPMAGAHQADRPTPTRMVTRGVTRMSILVSLLTSLPSSAAMMAMNSTARGPPAPDPPSRVVEPRALAA